MNRVGHDFTHSRILIIDDEPANIRLLDRILSRAGYAMIESTTDPLAAVDLFETFLPDLVLLDLNMQPIDGFAILDALVPRTAREGFLPILILTADGAPETRQRALSSGAKDFLTKPFDPGEVVLRIRNLLETRSLHLRLRGQNAELEAGVELRTQELEEARVEILECLSRAAEYRDDATGEHTRRVADLSAALAREIGVPAQEAALIRRAATLHDIGKIGIPDEILLKPGRLTPAEFDVMKQHATIGGRILDGSRSPVLQLAREVALTHHERWDGTGYPARLKGTRIPLCGRIVAVADTFDALTHRRPYKAAWSRNAAIEEVERQRGRQFDPDLVDAFHAVMRREAPVERAERAVFG